MFFQAKDGIRDTSVTGVQTCALPISFLILAGIFYIERPNPGEFYHFLPLSKPISAWVIIVVACQVASRLWLPTLSLGPSLRQVFEFEVQSFYVSKTACLAFEIVYTASNRRCSIGRTQT